MKVFNECFINFTEPFTKMNLQPKKQPTMEELIQTVKDLQVQLAEKKKNEKKQLNDAWDDESSDAQIIPEPSENAISLYKAWRKFKKKRTEAYKRIVGEKAIVLLKAKEHIYWNEWRNNYFTYTPPLWRSIKTTYIAFVLTENL